MLDKRKVAAAKELRNLLNLSLQEENRITENLKATGQFKQGLDGNLDDYVPLNREIGEKIKEIFIKYNLPPNTKLRLW